jgi:hypothetical protein
MTRAAFEGFSLDLPPGWGELADDATYSDPMEGERKKLGRPGSSGVLYLALLPPDPELPASAAPAEVESRARSWGRARGLAAPLSIAAAPHDSGTLVTAEYKLLVDYVAVWFLSNGEATLHASYLCAWAARDEDRSVRDEMIASLAFA